MAGDKVRNFGERRGLFRGEAVLVVDDEPLIRWCIKERLKQSGFEVRVAGTGKEALRQFGPPVHVVLLDLDLPDTDGLTLLHAFKRDAPDCRVIMMTASASDESRSAAVRDGAIAVLRKPFPIEQLVNRVREVMRAP